MKACGICGSDVHGMDGSTGRRRPPIIMGHEAAGVIAAVGPSVTDWKIGDRVTFDSTIYCGTCREFCRQGRINLCDNRRVLGVSCDDYRQHGAFGEYVAVPKHILYRLPDGLSFGHAAMVEAVSIAIHALQRTPVQLNDTAVVVGAGMIGLLVIQAARAAGCGRIIAVDTEEKRLVLAEALGATDSVCVSNLDTSSAVAKTVLSLTGSRGADVVFEVVGIEATVTAALNCVRKGGRVTLIGNLSPTVAFPLQAVVTREIALTGSCASSGEYPACLAMIALGAIKVNPLIAPWRFCRREMPGSSDSTTRSLT